MKSGSTGGLEFCLACERDFVSLIRCTRTGSGSWWLVLRCGECGTWHETFARDDAVSALLKAIADARDSVARSVRCLDLERMVSQVDAFSQALELDLIGADDF
jgi:hypothetical protein